jgi:hypothetical protein
VAAASAAEPRAVDRVEVGKTGLSGWRAKVADGVAEPVAERTSLSPDAVRAVVGAAFFVLSVYYVIGTAVRAARAARSS